MPWYATHLVISKIVALVMHHLTLQEANRLKNHPNRHIVNSEHTFQSIKFFGMNEKTLVEEGKHQSQSNGLRKLQSELKSKLFFHLRMVG